MASDSDLEALHRAAYFPVDDDTYTDELLVGLIDNLGSVEAAAAAIWREKAAAASQLVNISGARSSRSLSDIAKNALLLAQGFEAAEAAKPTARRAFTTGVERV